MAKKKSKKDLQAEINRLQEAQERALDRVRAVDEELSVLTSRTREIALATFDGERDAVRESEELREKKARLTHEREISAGAAEQAGGQIPALQEQLREAERQEKRDEFDRLQGEREALYPDLEKQVERLAATLGKANDLATKQARLAPAVGLSGYQDRWHVTAHEFLRSRLYRGCGMIFSQGDSPGGLNAPIRQSPLWGTTLDGRPLTDDPAT